MDSTYPEKTIVKQNKLNKTINRIIRGTLRTCYIIPQNGLLSAGTFYYITLSYFTSKDKMEVCGPAWPLEEGENS